MFKTLLSVHVSLTSGVRLAWAVYLHIEFYLSSMSALDFFLLRFLCLFHCKIKMSMLSTKWEVLLNITTCGFIFDVQNLTTCQYGRLGTSVSTSGSLTCVMIMHFDVFIANFKGLVAVLQIWIQNLYYLIKKKIFFQPRSRHVKFIAFEENYWIKKHKK